eukprot:g6965.t1
MVPSSDPGAAAEVTPAADSEASPAADAPRVAAPKPPPATTTSQCLGARGYDGGFHDVGSFFVFRHEALRQQQLAKDGGADLELFGAAPTGSSTLATPLQYELLDGLRVKVSPVGGLSAMEGKGSEAAGRAFEVLQRQVNFTGQALGCSVDIDASPSSTGADPEQDEAAENGTAEANGSAGNDSSGGDGSGGGGAGAAAANGKPKEPPRQRPEEQNKEIFALSNTEDNDSIQGLVRSGGCLWIGRFGLPPVQPGEDELEMVDIWPRSVARLSEGGARAITTLEGDRDAVGPLTAPTEHDGGSEALKRARRAHGLLVQALADVRPHVPTPPQSEGEEKPLPAGSASRSPSLAGRKGAPAPAGPYDDDDSAGRAMSVEDSEEDTEEETSSAAGGARGGRRGRKRPRVETPAAAASGSGSYKLRGQEAEDAGGGGGGNKNNHYSEEDEDEDEDEEAGAGEKDPPSAADMTVAAVRGSLLRNRSEGGAANPEVEEWESVVKNFILHVESLPPGTEQEELSLMFAAALDPTLVRMRAANTALVKLAEVCASPEGDPEDDGGGGSDGDGDGAGGKSVDSAATRKKHGFNVFLELEAPEGGAPPLPTGIEEIRRTVAAAAVVVEEVARADACIVHAGDTLGGLRELKTDYRRSLPPGPREPIQFIIAEEQARVLGYVSAHEGIVAQRMEKLLEAGAKVGNAYRSAEQEAGWNGVKRQVGSYLAEFEEYCRSLVSTIKPGSDILGMGAGPAAATDNERHAADAGDMNLE